jgi:hypothetical protein
MRRLLALVAVLAAGCSPAQEQAWIRWFHRQPRAAVSWAINECGQLCTQDWDRDGMVEPEPARDADQPDHPGEQDHWAPSGQCPQWYGTAIGVGFDDSEWPTVDRIMYAESRCNPGAYNSEEHFGGHASGLMQIIWPTWAGECGISDPFDPWQNLSCALYLKTTYGWSQWSTY